MLIEQVSNNRGLEQFIRLPWKVYEGDGMWAPPLVSESRFILGAGNPFFQHAEAAYFLARKNGEVVGRVAAIIDHAHVAFHGEKAGFFGFFECLRDPVISEKLLDAASSWLKARNMEIMRGPVNPSMNDECGFLLEGFDSPPMIMMTYSPAYYIDYMERCGLSKAMDLHAYMLVVDDVSSGERLERVAAAVRKKIPDLVVRPSDLKAFDRDLDAVKDVYNAAWSRNWGFVPMTDAEIESMARRLRQLIVPELLLIAEVNDKPAGFFLALPDYNQVLRRINGRLGPLGLMKFLWHSRRISDLRVLTMGVKEEFRRRGIESLLFFEAFKAAKRRGYRRAEMSWVLEDNTLMKRGCELMGGELYKKYRIYEKRIAS